MRVADLFDLEHLRTHCSQLVWKSMTEQDVFAVWNEAVLTSSTDVALTCLNFVEKHPDSFESAAFVRALPEVIEAVLLSDNLCVDEVLQFVWRFGDTCSHCHRSYTYSDGC